MNWIRIAVGIMRDPSVIALAEAVGVSVPATTGHLVGVLTSLPEGSASGDLSGVSDRTLEHWAMWTGKRGRFAAAFRAHLCDAHGVVRSWEKHNGASLRRATEAADRAKRWREQRRENAQRMRTQRVPNAHRTSLRDETRRDETNNPVLQASPVSDTSQGAAPRTRSAPKAGAKYPAFSTDLCDIGYQTWLAKLGATPYPAFRAAFGPLFATPEADRPPTMPRDAEFPRLIELYAVAIRGTKAAQFVAPAKCAGAASGLTRAAREPDPERRLLLARTACGTVEEQRRLEGMAA